MTTPSEWYAIIIQLRTGKIIGELPVADQAQPDWAQQMNDPGSYTVSTILGAPGALTRETFRSLVRGGKFGLGICYGSRSANDYIAQAGPVWTRTLEQENPPTMSVSGKGMWGILNARFQVPSGWIRSKGLGDASATATYTGSMHDIAAQIVSNQVARDTLQIDVPALTGGTASRTYYGYDMAYAGQRLMELTQQDGGPDVYFRPYFSSYSNGAGFVRWEMVIGSPTITAPGSPLLFDHGSNLVDALPSSDSSLMSTDSYVKGNGTDTSTLWAYANTPLSDDGILLEHIDSSHVDIADQTQLNTIASANQAINQSSVETWQVTVLTDGRHPLGSYNLGVQPGYNFTAHPLILNGLYTQRLLGLSNGQSNNQAVHVIQAVQGEM